MPSAVVSASSSSSSSSTAEEEAPPSTSEAPNATAANDVDDEKPKNYAKEEPDGGFSDDDEEDVDPGGEPGQNKKVEDQLLAEKRSLLWDQVSRSAEKALWSWRRIFPFDLFKEPSKRLSMALE